MKFPGLIKKGKGFRTTKKLRINWDNVGTGILLALFVAGIVIFLNLQLTPPISEPGQVDSQTPVPGSSGFHIYKETFDGSDEWVRDYEAEAEMYAVPETPLLVYEDAGPEYMEVLYDPNCPHGMGPILPLPPISLQQVYYDPWTGKLWYIDDDRVPHVINIQATVEVEVGLNHEFEGRD